MYSLLSAPGSYEVEKADKSVHQRASAHSFGVKYKDQKPDNVPGKSDICISSEKNILFLKHNKLQENQQKRWLLL